MQAPTAELSSCVIGTPWRTFDLSSCLGIWLHVGMFVTAVLELRTAQRAFCPVHMQKLALRSICAQSAIVSPGLYAALWVMFPCVEGASTLGAQHTSTRLIGLKAAEFSISSPFSVTQL
eukprot:6210142-Pleurochrysis_carterae.AAC.1